MFKKKQKIQKRERERANVNIDVGILADMYEILLTLLFIRRKQQPKSQHRIKESLLYVKKGKSCNPKPCLAGGKENWKREKKVVINGFIGKPPF